MPENFPNFVRERSIQIHEAQKSPNSISPKTSLRHNCNQIVNSQGQSEKFESSKRKASHHLQGHPHKTVSGFLSRNHIDQERVG